jgi:hypothetical protein
MNSMEAWLYGSVARGQYLSNSDLDVLVVGDPIQDLDLDPIVLNLPQAEHLSIRRYDWSAVCGMAAYGSLFLLHLKLEGRRLWRYGAGPDLAVLLRDLPRYSLVERDLAGFDLALSDVTDSLDDGGDPAFELSVVATVIRHCSILACYLMGRPCFDRHSSISYSFDQLDMSQLTEEALNLHHFRLAQARAIPLEQRPSQSLARRWCHHASDYVARVGASYA